MNSRKWFAVVASTSVLALGATACGDDEGDNEGGNSGGALSGEIAGAGASSQEAAMQAWVVGFQDSNPEATISYDPIGSGGGREQFAAGGVAFAGSDAALEGEELDASRQRCQDQGGELLQIPNYISPIAVVYNLPGVEGLQLSPETLAGIFNQEITTWNDPAIAEDNPDAELPDTRITPVNRSDESGTTENFVDYLAQTVPDVWTYPVDGNWPVKGGEAAQGTSGVVEAVGAGEGAIGYADASQAGDLGVATIGVGDEFVAPTPEAAAKIVETSEETATSDLEFAYALNRQTEESGTYPIILLSYLIGCTAYESPDEAALVKGLMEYVVSAEGQQAAAENAGSAPLSEGLTTQVESAIAQIGS